MAQKFSRDVPIFKNLPGRPPSSPSAQILYPPVPPPTENSSFRPCKGHPREGERFDKVINIFPSDFQTLLI